MSRRDTAMTAGFGAFCIAQLIAGPFLAIEWRSPFPAPVVSWVIADVLAAVGAPLLFFAYGRRDGTATPSWREILVSRMLPYLALAAVSVVTVAVLTRRWQPGIPPSAGAGVLAALGVLPALARLTRRLPTAVLLTATLVPPVMVAVLGVRNPISTVASSVLVWTACYVIGGRSRPATEPDGAAGRAGRVVPVALAALPAVTAALSIGLVPRLSAAPSTLQGIVAIAVPLLPAVLAGVIAVRLSRRVRVRNHRALVAVGAAGVVLVAVSGQASRSPDPGPSSSEITLAFAGDVHFDGRAARLLDDPSTAFGEAARVLSAGDVALLNLETPITTRRGTPEPKRYVFGTDARAATALRAAGVDAVSLANNHSLDHGRNGLADTVAAARAAGLGTFGAGGDAREAYAPWRVTVRGVRIAVLGFSLIDDLAERWAARPGRAGVALALDPEQALAAVAAARRDSDLVVVLPHWGTEGDPCPDPRQLAFARRLAAAGADIVVGAHAHVLQGTATIGGTYVAYGMGNFLWYSPGLFGPFSARSGVLTLTVQGRKVTGTAFTPTLVSDTGAPHPSTGWRASLARHNYEQLDRCAAGPMTQVQLPGEW
jgi:hypothetical protein